MGEKMNFKCFIIPKHFLPCQTWTVGIKQKPYQSENLMEKINLLLNFKIIYMFELQLDFDKCVYQNIFKNHVFFHVINRQSPVKHQP